MREEAKRRAELYQALADGKTLQGNFPNLTNPRRNWCDLGFEESMQIIGNGNFEPYLRIKPEPKKAWYRVVLFKNGTTTAESEHEEKRWSESNSNFICWLTDRIEYELPEGEA